MAWWWGALYLLGAALVLGGTSAAKGAEKFFEKSENLEKKLVEKLQVNGSNDYEFSKKMVEILKKVSESGDKLFNALKTKATSEQTT